MSLDLDLTLAKVVSEQMDDYVQAGVLFYPVSGVGGLQMPALSIGTWLETEWRLNAVRSTDPRIAPPLDAARAEVRKVRGRAQEPYVGLARREFKSRLDSWEQFLDDASDGAQQEMPFNVGTSYPAQVHNRFKLELLKNDVPQLDAQLSRLNQYDIRLHARFKPGAFVWEPELEHAAPRDKYWWLYGA